MVKTLNRVIEYIEEHLSDNLTLEQIARYAGVSDFHFRKLFFFLSGMTLSDYVRDRRLSRASVDLLHGARVTDVAFTFGYASLDGFTRAFKNFSGMLPSELRKGHTIRSCPKLTFIISVTGGNPMEYRIEEKPSFTIAGVSKRVPMQFEGVNQEIVKLACSITEAQRRAMHGLQDMDPREIVNASYEADAQFLREEGSLTHMIGVLTTNQDIPELLQTVTFRACTWAVFPNDGPFPKTLQDTMARIYAEWLTSSPYELIDAPSFSFTRMHADKENFAYSEVWVPVRKTG